MQVRGLVVGLVAAGLIASGCGAEPDRAERLEVGLPPAADPSVGLDLALAAATTTTTTTTAPPSPRPQRRASRSAVRSDLDSFVATCYELRGTTASGRPAGPGSIAVDPRVIPLGTRLRVSGYGEGIATDTGGAIKGRRVDVWMASGCKAWGRRSVTVEILERTP